MSDVPIRTDQFLDVQMLKIRKVPLDAQNRLFKAKYRGDTIKLREVSL
jgi:hypothetical protein